MAAPRVLITGVSSPLGARLAARLADDPGVGDVVGVDTRRPPAEIAGRITFVEADLRKREIGRHLKLAEPDVVVHHDIVQFPEPGRSVRSLHDLNVIGTLQLLAACGDLPGLRALVVRGSASIYGSQPDAPAFFTEDLARPGSGPAGSTRFQRDVAELERLVQAFTRRRPAVPTTVLRLQPIIGPSIDTPITRLLRAPVIPTFLGFDPRLQFVHEDDAVGAVVAAVHRPVRGPVNVAGEGTVSLTRVLRRLGKRALPIAAPLYGPAVGVLGRLTSLPALNDDVVRYLRNGRGVDTTRMRDELGFRPTYTTPEAIDAVAAALRARWGQAA